MREGALARVDCKSKVKGQKSKVGDCIISFVIARSKATKQSRRKILRNRHSPGSPRLTSSLAMTRCINQQSYRGRSPTSSNSEFGYCTNSNHPYFQSSTLPLSPLARHSHVSFILTPTPVRSVSRGTTSSGATLPMLTSDPICSTSHTIMR